MVTIQRSAKPVQSWKNASILLGQETKDSPSNLSLPTQTENYYVDALFAPLWDLEDQMDPSKEKSRSEYVVLMDDGRSASASWKEG